MESQALGICSKNKLSEKLSRAGSIYGQNEQTMFQAGTLFLVIQRDTEKYGFRKQNAQI